MLIAAAILGVGMAVLSLTSMFILWAHREHRVANKYRHLVMLAEQGVAKEGPAKGWTVTYRVGRTKKTLSVAGSDEQEAIKNAMKAGVSPDRFESIVRG